MDRVGPAKRDLQACDRLAPVRELAGAGAELDPALDLSGRGARIDRVREHACRPRGCKLRDRVRSSSEPVDRLARAVSFELADGDHVLSTGDLYEVIRLVLSLGRK